MTLGDLFITFFREPGGRRKRNRPTLVSPKNTCIELHISNTAIIFAGISLVHQLYSAHSVSYS